ncbi:MAG: winged helix-turn-helix domain-containing protein [Candidatus Bathyarchaeota archaeon]|nr:winged helix-turn-helix domain-containing protein [Candidatus Bathyarchaeota archaeon]
MTANKRSKVDIYSAILDSLLLEQCKTGKASPTRIAHLANLPYNRFQKQLEKLIKAGMVNRTDDGLSVTEKGINCLNEIRKANDFLRRMGLYP